jgi:hypothetical protein
MVLGANGITMGEVSRPVDRSVVCAVTVVPADPFGVTEAVSSTKSPIGRNTRSFGPT